MMNLEKYSTDLRHLGSNDREFKYALEKMHTYRKSLGPCSENVLKFSFFCANFNFKLQKFEIIPFPSPETRHCAEKITFLV